MSSLPLALLALLVISGACFSDSANTTTEGGNITNANFSAGVGGNSTWHGVVDRKSVV
jgi:hypothetical protein